MNYEDINPEVVMSLLGLQGKTSGMERIVKCPSRECDDTRGHMYININNGLCYCHKCGWSGNIISLYREMNGLETNGEALRAINNEIRLDTTSLYDLMKKRSEIKEVRIRNIDRRNEIINAFLDELFLTPKHRKDLKRRGFSDKYIDYYKYRSTPKKSDLIRIAPIMFEKFGWDCLGVPGFYKRNGELWISLQKPGIFVPVRDVKNRILGMQVRRDNEIIKFMEEKYDCKISKYCWFSSSWVNDPEREGSDGCGRSFIHYRFPWTNAEKNDEFATISSDGTSYKKPCFNYKDKSGHVAAAVTEGGMKADLFFQYSGVPVIALPGVNATSGFTEVLDTLKKLGVEKIYNLFDIDYITNKQVQKASERLSQRITERGFLLERPDWDTAYKGIDDYYKHLSDLNKNVKGIVV